MQLSGSVPWLCGQGWSCERSHCAPSLGRVTQGPSVATGKHGLYRFYRYIDRIIFKNFYEMLPVQCSVQLSEAACRHCPGTEVCVCRHTLFLQLLLDQTGPRAGVELIRQALSVGFKINFYVYSKAQK